MGEIFAFAEKEKLNFELNTEYKFLEEIGKGKSGVVYKVLNKNNNKYYSIKITQKNKDSTLEFNILERLKNVCIKYVLCYEKCYKQNNNFFIITEYLHGYVTINKYVSNDYYFVGDEKTDFQKLYKNLNIVFENLGKGLKLIHENEIVHRDINSYNILIDPTTLNIKYIDFELSNTKNNFDCEYVVGSSAFIDPNLHFNSTCNFGNLKRYDIFSLGILLFYIVKAETPLEIFLNKNLENLEAKMDIYFNNYNYNLYVKNSMVENVINKVNELRVNKINLKFLLSLDLKGRYYYCEK